MLRGKERLFRRTHRIGLINNLLFLGVVVGSCVVYGFQCGSHGAQSFLTQYAFWAFIPQAVIACATLIIYILLLGFAYPNDFERRDFIRTGLYATSLLGVIVVFFF